MRRNVAILIAIMASAAGLGFALAGFGSARREETHSPSAEPLAGADLPELEQARLAREEEERLDREYPLHGLVTKTQLIVRVAPEPEATPLGWLRVGAHIRAKRERTSSATCRSGWYEIAPRGWACAGQGIEVGEAAPAVEREIAPDLSSALPYTYFFVKEPQVPEWHQLPSREDQRAAGLHAARYLALLGTDAARATRLRAGELPGEPPPPREVARWLDHGFFIASNGGEVRSQRRFARTVRGSYVKESQLEARTGPSFAGIELNDTVTLPVAWAIRAAHPMIARERSDGTTRLVADDQLPDIERLARIEWLRREHVGDQLYHRVRTPLGERFLRDWFVAVAEKRDPPRGVAPDEPWVHVNLATQTLVLYRGAQPVYATLVSSGLEGHETPEGEFTIRQKMVTDTMAAIGPEAGDDRYRIEDVPWTQYFSGSIALHAAFWHSQFGQTHSHGCVNLAPRDAQYIFARTWPQVPSGWHGISTDRTQVRGSRVVVTR